YYRDAGIDLQILEGQPGLDIREFVLAEPGRISIGSSSLIIQHARGDPVVILEPIFQHAADVLISLESSNIRTPSDLVGKVVMDRVLKTDPYPGFRGMLVREGIDPDSVKWTDNSWNYEDLTQGRADVMSGYITSQIPEFRKRGIPIRIMNPLDYGIDLYGDILFTSAKTVKEEASALRRFMRASARGWIYAFEHTDEMVDYILNLETLRPRRLPRDLLEEEARETRRLVEPDLIPIGYSNPRRWGRIIELDKKVS